MLEGHAVEIIGEIDSVTASEVEAHILPLVALGHRILIDMSQVHYLSSAGLRALLIIYRKAYENKGGLVLSGLNDEVRDIMSITGFLDHFVTVETRQDGIRALS